MTDLRTLRDAFDELESRADVAPVASPTLLRPERAARRSARLAPFAAAGAVAATAAVLVIWQQAGSGSPAKQPAAGRPNARLTAAASTGPPASRYQPPTTGAQLAEEARAILGATATITVTDSSGSVSGAPAKSTERVLVETKGGGPAEQIPAVSGEPGATSGAAIVGTLTAAGLTGGFDLNVFATSPGSTALCDADTDCSVRPLADGSSLAVGSWRDDKVPGGITYQVEMVRADGADILLHLSTEQDPKGQSAVTASQLPLTLAQMTDFVSSDRW